MDDAPELRLPADGQGHDERLGPQLVLHLLDHGEEVRSDPVHLVDVGQPRHPIAVGLMPDRFGLRLDTPYRGEYDDRTVQNPDRALDLGGEVHVPGGVDDVDLFALPEAGGDSGGDRDPALLLLNHPVHGRLAIVYLSEAVALAGVVEDPFGRGGLAGVDVREDSYVADVLQRGHASLRRWCGLCNRLLCIYNQSKES